MDRNRFVALWSRNCGHGDSAGDLFEGIERSYGEPHRRYHTGAHIVHCLKYFDLARGEMDDPDAIELALWFHDVEYDPDAPDNELRSAERFRRSAEGSMDTALIEQVYRLIIATIHRIPPQLPDEMYVIDIDLSSFGLPWDEFYVDSRNVRGEFPHLSEREFALKNSNFLQRLLDRTSIYSTPFFRRLLESNARENIQRQMELLERLL